MSSRSRFLVKLVGCQTASEKGQAHEPAEEQIVFQVLAEPAFGRDGVEDLQELGPQEILRRDGDPAPLGIEGVEEGAHLTQGPGPPCAGWPQGVIAGTRSSRLVNTMNPLAAPRLPA